MTTSTRRSEPSELYLACRNGDVDFVKDYLTNWSDSKWNPNQFETTVKSTPLHAASYNGHKEIVQLLLNRNCDRSQLNGYGLTAYEEAANDEIRRLFKRPTSDSDTGRFQDDTIDGCFDFVKRPKESIEEVTNPSTPTESRFKCKKKKTVAVQGYRTEAEKQLEVGYATTSIAMCQSKLGRFLADVFHRGAPMSLRTMASRLQDIIDKEITANKDPQSEKANELLSQYVNDASEGSIEPLIRLYTLETNFYRALRQDSIPLALPLYKTLQVLKDRYFEGTSYRGAKMDENDIAPYTWAVNNHGSLVETRSFSSTSVLRSVAEQFSTRIHKKEQNDERMSVLFIFHFPIKCDQAINLGRVSNQLPCLSDFEEEAEVLLLPWTLFQVESVERDPSSNSCTINLTNVLLPRKNMLSSLKWVLRHPKGCLDRFYENFPTKQPETVVTELMKSLSIPDESLIQETEYF